MITSGKMLCSYTNSLNHFFKGMNGDQSGELFTYKTYRALFQEGQSKYPPKFQPNKNNSRRCSPTF